MRTRSVAAVVAVVLLLLVALATAAAAAEERPWKVSYTGTFEFSPGTHGCDKIRGDPPGPPLVGTPLYTVGIGEATHLGRMTIVETDCVYFTATPAPFFTDGSVTLTAANGDELRGSFYGNVTGPAGADGWIPITIVMEFDGGTGRFADATGQAVEVGRVLVTSAPGDPPAGLIEGTIEGEVTY